MKKVMVFVVLAVAAGITSADAKGCIKGALVGGVAGHYTVRHGWLGAAAGCVIGRHEANRRARLQQTQQNQQDRQKH